MNQRAEDWYIPRAAEQSDRFFHCVSQKKTEWYKCRIYLNTLRKSTETYLNDNVPVRQKKGIISDVLDSQSNNRDNTMYGEIITVVIGQNNTKYHALIPHFQTFRWSCPAAHNAGHKHRGRLICKHSQNGRTLPENSVDDIKISHSTVGGHSGVSL